MAYWGQRYTAVSMNAVYQHSGHGGWVLQHEPAALFIDQCLRIRDEPCTVGCASPKPMRQCSQ